MLFLQSRLFALACQAYCQDKSSIHILQGRSAAGIVSPLFTGFSPKGGSFIILLIDESTLLFLLYKDSDIIYYWSVYVSDSDARPKTYAKKTISLTNISIQPLAKGESMLLSAEHIYKNYDTKQLLQDATLYLNERDKIGIIGINGTGKSTLLKILAGLESPDAGSVTVQRNARISFLPQNPIMNDNLTVLEQVFAEFTPQFREINEYEVKSMLTRLGITDYNAKIGTLSGGQRKRVALCAALIHPSDILILDEPTNHLDSDMVIWLEARLSRFSGGLIMVTHDRYFLERVVNRITELSRAKLYTFEAKYSKYLELKAQREDDAEASERKRQAILRKEYQWIMRGAQARSTKSRGRIDRYNALKDQSAPTAEDTVAMATMSSRMGKKLIELKDISKTFDDTRVIDHFSYNIQRDDRIGIVGKNGVGKSTLLNIVAEKLTPDEGSVEVGSTVKIGYFTQEGRELDSGTRVHDFISEIASEIKTQEGTFTATQMLERFLFTSELQYANIGKLSGGERRRLYLLSILITAPNILLLDEPTNDLDIETLTIFEDYLESFPGAVITVSHDRYFLDKIANSIFEVTDGGKITAYTGNYTDYFEKRPITQDLNEKKEGSQAEPIATYKNKVKQKKLKFSFNEQREFDTIDDDISAIETKISECGKELEKASSDYIRLMELSAQMEIVKSELEAKTERWLYLNELADQINAQI